MGEELAHPSHHQVEGSVIVVEEEERLPQEALI